VSEVLERAFDTSGKSNWQIKTLGEVCRTSSGGTPSRSRPDFFNGNIPWVKSGELTDGLVSEVSEFISEEALAGSSAKLLPAGTLLIAMYGATVGKLGVLARAAATNQAVCAIFPPPELDPKFLFWYLRRQRSDLIAKAVGGAQPNISQTILRDVELPIPPIGEQREIVAELEKQFSRLDEAVANLQRVKANLKRYKASVLKAAVEGRLVETEATLARREGRTYETGEQLLQRVLLARPDQWSARGRYVEPLPPDTKDLSPLPDGWIWASIDQLSDFITKGTTPTATKMFDGAGEVQFLKVYNLTFNGSLNHTHKPAYVSRATHKDELARSQVFPGDVLINIVGPPLGQVSVVPAHIEEANINQAIARIRPVNPIGSAFIANALMCDDIMRWAIRRGKTTAGQANLTLELCRALPIPVPPLAEQARIVAEVDRHLSIIREVEAEVDTNLRRAQALRQATLARAFLEGVK
jgi:type I restriction enzyme S subunit